MEVATKHMNVKLDRFALCFKCVSDFCDLFTTILISKPISDYETLVFFFILIPSATVLQSFHILSIPRRFYSLTLRIAGKIHFLVSHNGINLCSYESRLCNQ